MHWRYKSKKVLLPIAFILAKWFEFCFFTSRGCGITSYRAHLFKCRGFSSSHGRCVIKKVLREVSRHGLLDAGRSHVNPSPCETILVWSVSAPDGLGKGRTGVYLPPPPLWLVVTLEARVTEDLTNYPRSTPLLQPFDEITAVRPIVCLVCFLDGLGLLTTGHHKRVFFPKKR